MAWYTVLLLLCALCSVGAKNCRGEEARERGACENLCDDKGNCTVRAALLLPRNTSYDASLTMVESTIELALQQEAIKQAFPDWVQFEWMSYDVEDCDAAYAVIGAIDAYNDCAHVFFGPSCDFALASVARIAKFLGSTGTPMVTTGGFSFDFVEPKQNCSAEFYMLVRAGPVGFKDLAFFLIDIMRHFEWGQLLLINEPEAQVNVAGKSSCLLMMKSFANYLKKEEIIYTPWDTTSDAGLNYTENLKIYLNYKYTNAPSIHPRTSEVVAVTWPPVNSAVQRATTATLPAQDAPTCAAALSPPRIGTDAVPREPTSRGNTEPIPSTSRADEQTLQHLTSQPASIEVATDLDEDLLKILGEDPSQIETYANNIREEIAVRLQHIATAGLSKEARAALVQKYLMPANCTLIDAPALNPEIKAAISEQISKRDKGIEIRQKQWASAIACLTQCLTSLMSEQHKNTTVIQLLMDSCKILCDGQYVESTVRRNLILINLKKELRNELCSAKIDKLLFSQDLADKLKAAKAINKSGDDLKPSQPRTTQMAQQTKRNIKPPTKNLNWRGPPQNYRPKGTPGTKEPARKSRHDKSSSASSRPATQRSSRR